MVYFSGKIGNKSITMTVKCVNILNRCRNESDQNVMLINNEEFGVICSGWIWIDLHWSKLIYEKPLIASKKGSELYSWISKQI